VFAQNIALGADAMDAKEQSIARVYRSKLAAGEYDELDVYGMLILLREHARPGTAVF